MMREVLRDYPTRKDLAENLEREKVLEALRD
jgi:hypothetical protein